MIQKLKNWSSWTVGEEDRDGWSTNKKIDEEG